MQIKWHYYEINFNLIQLPKDSVLHGIDLSCHLYSSVVHRDQYSLNFHTCVKWHIYCDIAFCLWYWGLDDAPAVLLLCFGTHTCYVPFRAGEEINLPTAGNCAHANCFEKPFFILYGAISSESLFENRQTLTFILELWHCGVQKAVLFSSLALCSGSAMQPQRQFWWQILLTLLRWKTTYGNPSHGPCQGFR